MTAAQPYEGMTAVIYARSSTDEKTQRPEMQIEDIENWCVGHGITILSKFLDDGYTGANMDRPGMTSMLGYLSLKSVNMVVAQDCTRISRSNDDMERFLKIIKGHGTVLRYTMADIIPETGAGKTINCFVTNQGEEWRTQHSMKVKKGIRYSQNHGTKSGRPVGRPVCEIDVEIVMECADKGYTLSQTARILDYKRTTLREHLRKKGLLQDYYNRCQKTPLTENIVCLNIEGQKSIVPKADKKDILSDSKKEFSDSNTEAYR